MTLRTRLAVVSALILVVAVGTVGVVLSQSARETLIDPIDARLSRWIAEVREPRADSPAPVRTPGVLPVVPGRVAARARRSRHSRDSGLSKVSSTGRRPQDSRAVPIRFPIRCRWPTPTSAEWRLSTCRARMAPSISVQWRSWSARNLSDSPTAQRVARRGAWTGGARRALSRGWRTPCAPVRVRPATDIGRRLGRSVATDGLVTAFVALAIGGALTWWMVRRSFRPVDQTIAIAARIGDGDLSLRVPEPAHPSN